MKDLYFDGEIILTEKGKENKDQICEELESYCIVNDSEVDRFAISGSDTDYYYNETKEFVVRMSEKGYVKEACFDIGDVGEYWRLNYIPEKNEWHEIPGKILYKNDVQDALKILAPEQQKAVMDALWNQV